MNLPKETQRATRMLKGKTVNSVKNFRKKEVLIEFNDAAATANAGNAGNATRNAARRS
jgi:hypothetical protein